MVHTRHSGDIEVVESPKFMSLDNERDRFDSQKKERAVDSLQSRRAYQDDDDDEYNIFEDKVLDSRLRPRTGPRRAYNYLDADSSDDDQSRRHKRHSPHLEMRGELRRSRSVKEERLEGYQQSTRRMSSMRLSTETDVNEDDYQIRRSLRRSRQSLRSQSHGKYAKQSDELMVDDQKNGEEDTENEEQKDQDSDDEEAKDQEDTDNENQNDEFSDMYSRVKRKRLRIKHNVYDDDDDRQNRNNNQREDTDEEEDVTIRRSERTLRKKQPQIVKSYSLREHKPRTVLYKAPVVEPKIRKSTNNIFEVTPTKKTGSQPYQSPAQRKKSRKRSAMHSSSSSTSSSSGSESSDEKSFKKRKAKSMAKARSRMMPMNFFNSNQPSNVIKDRIKSGASLADVEPMNIDKNITFDSIGGLGKHIRALKEMVVFPLLYDKVFQRFNVDPPRGVLFYGPPGTGKTLVARALANECSHGDKKVAFFMRKGADCLSKWVGESERQLRLLFDQAYKYRPSIIFFDEIDGLAPVRSSRQDQIHSSIVSTLLALMDGLDSRGEIVVIGATNRIDSLDPALRRPGRFDREFLFPLPSLEARTQILKIQTASWNPRLNDGFITELAEKCVGYCGADLKALCTEAAMLALRRRYPQIYISNEALQLDESSISVCAKDFFNAVSNIIPTSRRSVNTPGRPLSLQVFPLLERQLNKAITQICDTFPPCLMKMSSLDAAATSSQAQTLAEAGMVWEELASDEDEDAPSIYINPSSKGSKSQSRKSLEDPCSSKQLDTFLNFTSYSTHQPTTFRPRIMLAGNPGQGQTSYIAPAVIHKMEDLPVHVLDLPALYAVTAKTPEESCANVFQEAKRKCPSIIYMPYINQWWNVLGDTLRTTLLTLIQDLNPSTPLLLLATSEQPYFSLDSELQSLFSEMSGEVMKVSNPNTDERKNFFKELLYQHSCKAPPQKKQAGKMIELLNQSRKIDFIPHNFCQLRKSCKSVRMKNFTKYKETIKETKHDLPMRKYKECQYKKLSSSTKTVPQALNPYLLGSTHKMTLRSSKTIHGCNNNHTADNGRILTYRNDSQCDKLICVSSSSMRPINVLWIRHYKRLKLRFPRIKRFDHGTWIDTNCSNKHCQFSKRHRRYLHRLEKDCCTHSKVKSSTARSIVRHIKKQKRCHPHPNRSLSCGSAQMLYRRNTEEKRLFHSNANLLLPINLLQLKKCSQLRPQLRSRKSKPCRKIQFQYNLRSRSTQVSNCRVRSLDHPKIDNTAKRILETLPKAAPVAPKELTKQEMSTLLEKEELTLMELRIFLRDVLHKLGSDKKFSIFAKAVDSENILLHDFGCKGSPQKLDTALVLEEHVIMDPPNMSVATNSQQLKCKLLLQGVTAPDYYEVIENPMDLSAMMSKIDCHEYNTVRSFMDDIDLICSNALEYNPDRGPMDRVIRHRSCALKDTAYAIIKTELDKDFEKLCVEIEESRTRRGTKSSTIPNFIRTKPVTQNAQLSSQPTIPSYLNSNRPARSIPEPEGERFSRRVRGLHIDPSPSLEDVEKSARTSHGGSPLKDDKTEHNQNSQTGNTSDGNILATQEENTDDESNRNNCANDSIDSKHIKLFESKSQTDPLHKKYRKQSKCVWCKPSRRRKKTFHPLRVAAMRRNVIQSRPNIGKRDEEKCLSSLVSQPLNIDTSITNESDELKSPVRKSSRLTSPQIPIAGVTTRRQSISPRSKEIVETKLPQGKIPIQDSTNKHTSLPEVLNQSIAEESPCTAEKEQTGFSKLLENKVETLKQVESKSESKKANVVKRLDLDFAVDSGAGSSLDGNGDSRDSTDNKFEEAHPSTSTSQLPSISTSQQATDFNENCNPLAQKASMVVNENPPKFLVPTERLVVLLNKLVLATEDYNVECLEKIYSQLSQIIFRHRHKYDRSDMVTELEKKVTEMTRQLPTTSSLR